MQIYYINNNKIEKQIPYDSSVQTFSRRSLSDNQIAYIEGQTTQWQKQKNNRQCFAKHYTES
jgi:hypothetical protein